MKILIIVPDGVGIRNYLYSNFISELEKEKVEVLIYHKISMNAIKEIKSKQKNISFFKEIPTSKETLKVRLLRESLCYARLLRNKKKLKNDTIMSFWNTNQKGVKQNILYRTAELLGTLFSMSERLILSMDASFEKAITKLSSFSKITSDLKEFNPDILLNLHQRSPLSAPIISSAKSLGIKTTSVIFSWDNVPKARLISRYDNYFVWSKLMKEELKTLYPEIKEEAIKIVGTPQFEFYNNQKFYKSKQEFFNEYGLDINKKTICYSSNDKSLPYDPNYLEDICKELLVVREEDRPQIIFRICPVDKSSRFNKILEEYKSFVFPIAPDWQTADKESFTAIFPAFNDINLLLNTVKHSDLVINMGSTMALDFAILDTPTLYLNYDPVSNPVIKVRDVYNFQHFKSMKDIEAVGWINSKEEIKIKILNAIKTPEHIGSDRKIWLHKIVNHLGSSSKELVKQLIA